MKALKTEVFKYKHGQTELEGYLAYDHSTYHKRPGILVSHAWFGQTPQVRRRVVQLAQLGYVGFALDMYGGGRLAKDAEEAAKLSEPFRQDRELMRERAKAGLDALRACRMADSRSVAAVGYCFGGTVALEMARGGSDVSGVVAFHAALDTPRPKETRSLRAKVLALHAAEDPSVPPEQVRAFQEEMISAKADWQLVIYGGATHGFTNPDAGSDKSTGAAYNEAADKRSWQAMRTFFAELF